MSEVKHLTKEGFADFTSKGLCLVDFFATWCGPCKMVAPVLAEIAEKMPEISIGKIDVDECNELAKSAGVSAIPNICLYKEGKLVDRIVGFDSQENIIAFIKKYL